MLQYSGDNYGYFTMIFASTMEGPDCNGYFKTKDGKIIFEISPDSKDFSTAEVFFSDLSAELDSEKTIEKNYEGYVTDFDENSLTIGSAILDNVKDKDINSNDSVKINYYTTTNNDKSSTYSLCLLYNDDNHGFFKLSKVTLDKKLTADGAFNIEGETIRYSVGPYAADNDFTDAETLLSDISANLGELGTDVNNPNYKEYKTGYDANNLTIGNLTFKKINAN